MNTGDLWRTRNSKSKMTTSGCIRNQFWQGLSIVNTRAENEVWTTYWKVRPKKKKLKKNILSPWNFGSNIGLFHFHSKRLSSRRQTQLSGKNYRGKIFPSCLFLFSKVRGFTSQTQELALPAFLLSGIILTLKSWLDDTKSTMSNIQMTEQMHKLKKAHFC